ncbi:uncharacterized protein LOC134231862 [Saccostrea cucullata]|uniref:uncharacterized protein LOC134231862 n=1 Tax=Saccostrea cuccullata TaxID=36930 RepID=UPI002ED3488B
MTGVCPQQKTSRISLVSMAIFLAAGIMFVAALVVCLFVKRSSRKMSSNSYNNYMPESSTPADLAVQSYARVEENVYHECEPLSLNYSDPTYQDSEGHYDRYNIPEIFLRKKAKPTILSILMNANRSSETNVMNRGYLHVIDIETHTTESSGIGQNPPPQQPAEAAEALPPPSPATPQPPLPGTAVETAKSPQPPPTHKRPKPSQLQKAKDALSLANKTAREPRSTSIKQMIELFDPKHNF